VLWRGGDRLDKSGAVIGMDKVPFTTDAGAKASTTNPQTWTSFARCVQALPRVLKQWEAAHANAYRGGGIGYVFAPDDPYVGIDLDHCVVENVIDDWAVRVLGETLHSYTELSPSRTGLHILVHATLPPGGRKKGQVEMYDAGRFFTMTGWHVPETPRTPQARQDALQAFHAEIFGVAPSTHAPHQAPQRTRAPRQGDAQLLDQARGARNSAKFTALWAGDTSAHGGDDSAADLALCLLLAFWSQDPAQLDRLFRQSGLMRDKWDEKHGTQTYGDGTIAKALSLQSEHYQAPGGAGRRRGGKAPGEDSPTADLQDTRVVIRIGPDITRMVDEGQDALLALTDGPVLFQRARRLSVIARGVKPPRWLRRTADAPVIVEAPAAYLDELATTAARWEKFDKRARKGEEWVEVTPPTRFVKTLQGRPAWPFPLLEGLIQSPTLRPDGSILDTPGYDVDTGLFFDNNGTTFPTIKARPTIDEARSAIGRLQEVVHDFPFAEDCHFAAWLSAVLSVVCRHAIAGCVPMYGITATAPASGKSKLSDTIALIGTGHTAARWSQVTEEEEERKRLFTLALSGDPLIVIDNVTAPLGSGALANTLTATSLKERILGTLEEKEAPITAVFLCTGNNMQYVNDVARRVVPIAIDPKMERPEERTGFLHPDLPAWVQHERPRLVVAALTIVKAYFVAGCPSQGITPLGSFEQWSDLIRQALVWAGEKDPNEGRKDIQATSNPEFERLAMLLHAWKECYASSTAITLNQVIEDIRHKAQHIGPETTKNTWNDLQDALGACDPKYDGKSLRNEILRYFLRKWQGSIIDGMRLISDGTQQRATKWRLDLL
jgi:hypothetical protein